MCICRKCIQGTHGTTSYLTISNNFKNYYEDIKEADEVGSPSDEFELKESGYTFGSITKKQTNKQTSIRYLFIKASKFCR